MSSSAFRGGELTVVAQNLDSTSTDALAARGAFHVAAVERRKRRGKNFSVIVASGVSGPRNVMLQPRARSASPKQISPRSC